LNKAANTYWIDTRLAAQRPDSRALALPSPARPASDDAPAVAATRALSRRNSFAVPSWVFFCMIVFATFAVCVTVTMRTHAEMRSAEQKFQGVSSDVERLRGANENLRREVERLRTDPGIEAAARTRLNMVRANEVVVPLD
jgi:cell division protein FtsB